VGSPASCMELELYGADDKFYSKLDQEAALLGSYPVDDGCRIHVRPPCLGPHSFIYSADSCRALPHVITNIGPTLMEPPVQHGEKWTITRQGQPRVIWARLAKAQGTGSIWN
jgi:hypothetical protein